MTGLKRLSKLRQYDDTQDVKKFLKTQHRQNMLALETSLKDLGKEPMGSYLKFSALTIENNSISQLLIDSGFIIDFYSLVDHDTLVLKETGIYEFIYSFFNLVVNEDRAIYLEFYVNDVLRDSYKLFESDGSDVLKMSGSFSFPQSLNAKDVLSFKINNDGSSSVHQASLDSSLLKMNKLKM